MTGHERIPGPATPPPPAASARAATTARVAAQRERARIDRPTMAQARELRMPFLHRIHPLAKFGATTAALVSVFFVNTPWIPGAISLLAVLVLLAGTRLTWFQRALVVLGMPLLAAVLAVTLGIWVDPRLTVGTQTLFEIGDWQFRRGALESGFATSMRLMAIVSLSLVGGLTTSGADFVRALVQQLRVPYRFGYAGLAAMRFVPRFRHELSIIRQAHRARGISFGSGPVGWTRRQLASLVPLLAAAMRHADRVALSMDARAFGYRETRTERQLVPVRAGDWVFLVLFLLAVAAIFVAGATLGLA